MDFSVCGELFFVIYEGVKNNKIRNDIKNETNGEKITKNEMHGKTKYPVSGKMVYAN